MIKARTGADWWAWQGWDLGVEFNKDGNRLGIEASFKQGSFDNPLGVFGIYVTVWNRKHYEPYREALAEAFPGCELDEHPENAPSRIYLHVPVIEDNDTDVVLYGSGVFELRFFSDADKLLDVVPFTPEQRAIIRNGMISAIDGRNTADDSELAALRLFGEFVLQIAPRRSRVEQVYFLNLRPVADRLSPVG